MMKRFCLFIILSLAISNLLLAKEECTELRNFKENYVRLLNDLKVDGKDVELNGDGHIVAKKGDGSKDLPGNKIEQELYNHYNNALIKIAKAYQFINKDKSQQKNLELLKANDAVAAFFRVIDPLNNEELARNKEYKLYIFLEQMQKIDVQPKEFKLTDTDKYFLTKLYTHSQDKICVLRQLHKDGNDIHDYLKSTSNQIITSLKKLTKNDSLELVKEDSMIINAINKNIDSMRKIIQKPECFKILKEKSNKGDLKKFFGPDREIQACNYGLFLKTLKNSDYDNFDTILHFINANQLAKDGKTGLDWITDQLENQKSQPPSCTKNADGSYTISDPSNSIDDNLFSCDKGSVKLTNKECFNLFTIEVTSGKAKRLTLKNTKDNHNISLTIDPSINCKKLNFDAPNSPQKDTQQTDTQNNPSIDPCTKEKCEQKLSDDLKKIFSDLSWDEKESSCMGKLLKDQSKTQLCKANKTNDSSSTKNKEENQSDEEKCKAKNKEYITNSNPSEGIPTDRYIWDGKSCLDKQDKNTQSQDQNEPTTSGKSLNDKQGIVPRFIPINIPTRQMFVLPGMP